VRSLTWLPDSATLLTACDDGYINMCARSAASHAPVPSLVR
jgi:hypothetical protein